MYSTTLEIIISILNEQMNLIHNIFKEFHNYYSNNEVQELFFLLMNMFLKKNEPVTVTNNSRNYYKYHPM